MAESGPSLRVQNRKVSSKKADAQGTEEFFLSCKRSQQR
jgi:hypothetical protein